MEENNTRTHMNTEEKQEAYDLARGVWEYFIKTGKMRKALKRD